MDGVVCEDAAKDIKITNGKDRGTQTVVLKTTGELTKELAITAIGERHKKFIVIAVKQGQPIVEDVEEEGADEAGKKKRRRGDREKGSSRKRQSREKDEAKTEKKAEA